MSAALFFQTGFMLMDVYFILEFVRNATSAEVEFFEKTEDDSLELRITPHNEKEVDELMKFLHEKTDALNSFGVRANIN